MNCRTEQQLGMFGLSWLRTYVLLGDKKAEEKEWLILSYSTFNKSIIFDRSLYFIVSINCTFFFTFLQRVLKILNTKFRKNSRFLSAYLMAKAVTKRLRTIAVTLYCKRRLLLGNFKINVICFTDTKQRQDDCKYQ